MRNMILVTTTMLMVILAVACSEKDAKSDKDADNAACTDVEKGADATGLADTATLTDKEKKEDCYVGCLESDMSKEDCKKACYGKWSKDDKPLPADAGSEPKEADADAPDAVNVPEDVTPQG